MGAGAGGAPGCELIDFQRTLGDAFYWGLSVSDGPPRSVIGSPPTLRRSVGALLLRIVFQCRKESI